MHSGENNTEAGLHFKKASIFSSQSVKDVQQRMVKETPIESQISVCFECFWCH